MQIVEVERINKFITYTGVLKVMIFNRDSDYNLDIPETLGIKSLSYDNVNVIFSGKESEKIYDEISSLIVKDKLLGIKNNHTFYKKVKEVQKRVNTDLVNIYSSIGSLVEGRFAKYTVIYYDKKIVTPHNKTIEQLNKDNLEYLIRKNPKIFRELYLFRGSNNKVLSLFNLYKGLLGVYKEEYIKSTNNFVDNVRTVFSVSDEYFNLFFIRNSTKKVVLYQVPLGMNVDLTCLSESINKEIINKAGVRLTVEDLAKDALNYNMYIEWGTNCEIAMDLTLYKSFYD